MFTSTAIACFAALAAAAPPAVTPYTATFDDLGRSPGAIAPIGRYDGLDYKGIDLVTLGANGAVAEGVIPQSSPNAGAYGATTIASQGGPQLDTSGTNTKVFDFNQLYFGCVGGTVESFASPPVSCKITVTGYRAGNEVATQSFVYTPGPGPTAPMERAILGLGFKAIDRATFSTSYNVGPAGATLLDNLSYITASS